MATATRIGILTSGGDAPGMNAAVRGAVRAALAVGLVPYAVREGYAGLVAGGDHIAPITAAEVSNVVQRGGTILGTARAEAFRSEEGRRTVVHHLVRARVSRLLVVGGDGSLTGLALLQREWPAHVRALVAAGRCDEVSAEAHPTLRAVGLVGSIDNDMVGTDTTIGCDSALHRIVDAIDALTATARSHRRSNVLEVMGRRCGYLALMAAVCGGADHVLLPEAPSPRWREEMVAAMAAARTRGKRTCLVVLAEGARDPDGRPITAEMVQAEIEAHSEFGARITTLGHVQRGGVPSAYDRVMGTVLGTQGILRLRAMAPGDPPLLMTTHGPEVRATRLAPAVAATHAVTAALASGRIDEVHAARGLAFAELTEIHRQLTATRDLTVGTQPRVAVVHVGAPAPGMNATVRAVARLAAARGFAPWGAREGLPGLIRDQVAPLDWLATEDIASWGSAVLGTDRWWPDVPADVVALDGALDRHDITAVVLIGGFEALRTAAELEAMGISAAVVPATISNNVPATDRSVGCDTAENAICEAVDRLKQSAIGSRRRVFVVEVMGRACGYLAEVGGIATGAEAVYTHERGIDLPRLDTDVRALVTSFAAGREVGLVLVADGASDAYDAAVLRRIYGSEAQGRFDTRLCVLGHLQQGGRPSPRDRLAAVRLAAGAVDHIVSRPRTAVVVGLDGERVVTTPCAQALAEADLAHRRPHPPRYANLVAAAGAPAPTR
ncbi:MAG: 6-phosphofructokinase [Myxococcota bacterium]